MAAAGGRRAAASQRRVMALRYKLHGGGEDEHQKFPTMIQYESGTGAGMWELRDWIPGETYSMPIDPKFIDADGTLKLRIFSAGWSIDSFCDGNCDQCDCSRISPRSDFYFCRCWGCNFCSKFADGRSCAHSRWRNSWFASRVPLGT